MTTPKEVVATIKAQAKRIEKLESALKVIHTWATFDNGACLVPKATADICKKAIRKGMGK